MPRQNLQAVMFDYDGVILESNLVKSEALRLLFTDQPEEMQRRIAHFHHETGGISRRIKIERVCREFLNQPCRPEELDELAERFSKNCREGMLASGYVWGARELLEKLQSLNIPAFVVTGAPIDEAREIVIARGEDSLFREVYGSPDQKRIWVERILLDNGFTPESCVFIGDAETDQNAAWDNKVPFIGRMSLPGFDPFDHSRCWEIIDDLVPVWNLLTARFHLPTP